MKNSILIFLLSLLILKGYSQAVPSSDEKFPFLCTFSKEALTEWGDDDFTQIFFFSIPENEKKPFYIRIFDADNGGKHDEVHGDFNSKTSFTVYGGKGVHSDPDAKKPDPVGNYRSGIKIVSKTINCF